MENPELYAVASALQKRDAALVLSQYLGRFNWTQQDDILDFGCGTGDITRHLSDLFPKFVFPYFIHFIIKFFPIFPSHSLVFLQPLQVITARLTTRFIQGGVQVQLDQHTIIHHNIQ